MLKFFIVGGFAQSSQLLTPVGTARNSVEKLRFQFAMYETINLSVNPQLAGFQRSCFSTVAIGTWTAGWPYGSIACSRKLRFSGAMASHKGSIFKENL